MPDKDDLEKLRGKQIAPGVTVIDRREVPEGKCAMCGAEDELRPYGPKGEWICFDCGMKDEKTTAARFRKIVFGEETQ